MSRRGLFTHYGLHISKMGDEPMFSYHGKDMARESVIIKRAQARKAKKTSKLAPKCTILVENAQN